jgi:hypothetical protein
MRSLSVIEVQVDASPKNALIRTPFQLAADIGAVGRPVAIDGLRQRGRRQGRDYRRRRRLTCDAAAFQTNNSLRWKARVGESSRVRVTLAARRRADALYGGVFSTFLNVFNQRYQSVDIEGLF